MVDKLLLVLTLLSALGSGLIAGVFFAFSTFVMKALARLVPAQGIAAMQSINLVVINPMFFAVFLEPLRVASFSRSLHSLGGRSPVLPTCLRAACSISWAQFW